MDDLDEYADKFKRVGIRTPTKEEVETFKNTKDEGTRNMPQGEKHGQNKAAAMIPENQMRIERQPDDFSLPSQSCTQSTQENNRKKMAANLRENMRVRKSFSFDPMATKTIFSSLKIYIEIQDDDEEYAEEVRLLCEKLGATIQNRLIYAKRQDQGQKTDLIVWHRGDFKTIEKAEANEIPMVNHNWVFESISKQAKLPFEKFQLTNYEKEEAKTRSELGIGSRRKLYMPTKRLSRNPGISLSEQKPTQTGASMAQGPQVPKQTQLYFSTVPKDSEQGSTQKKPLSSRGRDSATKDPNPVSRLPVAGQTKTTQPMSLQYVPPPSIPKPSFLQSSLSQADNLAAAMHSHLKSLCMEDSELRDIILENEDLKKELGLDHLDTPEGAELDTVAPKLQRKSVKTVRESTQHTKDLDKHNEISAVKPVQATLNWDRVKARISASSDGSDGDDPGHIIPLTKFLKVNNQFASSSSKPANRAVDNQNKSAGGDLLGTVFKTGSKPTISRDLTIFYAGEFPLYSRLKGLLQTDGQRVSIIQSKNFHFYQLKPENTLWYYEAGSKPDLGLLWAVINRVSILTPQAVQKWISAGSIDLGLLQPTDYLPVETITERTLLGPARIAASESLEQTTSTTTVLKIPKRLFEGVYFQVHKLGAKMQLAEYRKTVETLEAAILYFGGKLADTALLDIIVAVDEDLTHPATVKQLISKNAGGGARLVRVDWLLDSIITLKKLDTLDARYAIKLGS